MEHIEPKLRKSALRREVGTAGDGAVTIYDVARRAGVSAATASRALNGNGKEVWKSAAARAEQIRQIARDLGYRPDYRAKTLATNRTRTVGMLYSEDVPFLANGYDEMWLAFSRTLIASRYHLAFVHIDANDPLSNPLLSNGLDAAMVYHAVPEAVREAVESLDRPRVVVNTDARLRGAARFVPDDAGGARQAVNHLAALGHRCVAFVHRVHPQFVPHSSLAMRRDASREHCRACGIRYLEVIASVDDEIEPLIDQLAPGGRPKMSGVIAYNANDAFAVVNGLYRRGISVPGRVSVVGFDDTQATRDAIVPLTTLRIPMGEMGRLAAESLLNQLSAQDDVPTARTQVLPEQLIVRASTGPAPAV
jgi:DNA-binding LacI/PurR family transcriptional regulator